MDELGDTETGAEEKLYDGAIAETVLVILIGDVKDAFEFVIMEEGDLGFDDFREVD